MRHGGTPDVTQNESSLGVGSTGLPTLSHISRIPGKSGWPYPMWFPHRIAHGLERKVEDVAYRRGAGGGRSRSSLTSSTAPSLYMAASAGSGSSTRTMRLSFGRLGSVSTSRSESASVVGSNRPARLLALSHGFDAYPPEFKRGEFWMGVVVRVSKSRMEDVTLSMSLMVLRCSSSMPRHALFWMVLTIGD